MQKEKVEVLICGAGPTGLAAALFLTEFGIPVRIIDNLEKHSGYSKALGVNARTLSLLKPTGVTEKLLQSGNKIYGMNTWHEGSRVMHLDLSKVDSAYKFMLINPQCKTEEKLEEALAAKGVKVERSTELTDINVINTKQADVTISKPNAKTEKSSYACVFAADGAHSTIRHKLEIDFPGDSFPEPWYFYDVEMDTSFYNHEGQVILTENSAIIMLPIQKNLWRIGGNQSDILKKLPKNCKVISVQWDAEFTISHRVISKFNEGSVYFGGDAAHLHSPVGGRGMNLGIEDAFVFATLYANDRLSRYMRYREPCVKKLVSEIERMSQMPRGKGAIGAVVRKAPSIVKMVFPILAPSFGKWVLGLDHPVIPDKT